MLDASPDGDAPDALLDTRGDATFINKRNEQLEAHFILNNLKQTAAPLRRFSELLPGFKNTPAKTSRKRPREEELPLESLKAATPASRVNSDRPRGPFHSEPLPVESYERLREQLDYRTTIFEQRKRFRTLDAAKVKMQQEEAEELNRHAQETILRPGTKQHEDYLRLSEANEHRLQPEKRPHGTSQEEAEANYRGILQMWEKRKYPILGLARTQQRKHQNPRSSS